MTGKITETLKDGTVRGVPGVTIKPDKGTTTATTDRYRDLSARGWGRQLHPDAVNQWLRL